MEKQRHVKNPPNPQIQISSIWGWSFLEYLIIDYLLSSWRVDQMNSMFQLKEPIRFNVTNYIIYTITVIVKVIDVTETKADILVFIK